MLTFEQIKELIDLVTERRLQGVEIERSGFRLKIEGRERVGAGTGPVAEATVERALPVPQGPAAAPPVPAPAVEEAEGGAPPENGHVLNSPIVGTFYSAPNPDSDPYVRVGDRVKKGQVLCIIEAMKLMNEIESDAEGKLLTIFPQNGQPVEFGEPLFSIQTD